MVWSVRWLLACSFVCLFASPGCWSVGRSLAISSKSNQRTSQPANHLNKYINTHASNWAPSFSPYTICSDVCVLAIASKCFDRTSKNIYFDTIYFCTLAHDYVNICTPQYEVHIGCFFFSLYSLIEFYFCHFVHPFPLINTWYSGGLTDCLFLCFRVARCVFTLLRVS